MAKKYFFIFFLLLSLTACQHNHKSQSAPNGKASENIVNKRGYLLNITAGSLTNLAKIDPNLILVDVSGISGNDSVIKAHFIKPKYIHIPASEVYLKPDTLPQGKSIVLVSLTGRKSQKLAYFLVSRGMTIYNLEGGIRGYKIWIERKKNKTIPTYDTDTLIEKHDFGC
jgi:rhodanese-related sulfurtransferase